jgi:nucleoside-diphosphate-sugar epimerase
VGARLRARLDAMGGEVFAPHRGDPGLLDRDLGVVFYCAGLTADYDRRPFDAVEAHVSLLSRVLQTGRFERLIYLSSTRLYDGLASARVDEASTLRLDPASARHTYDLSKALGENLTLTRSGGRGGVARLSNVYDWEEGAPGFLSAWLIRARAEREIVLDSSPHLRRDYIHLDDVVASLLAMASAPALGIVNVASGELVSNGEIAALMAQAGRSVRFTGDADPPASPSADITRLMALGVAPRPVKDVVRRYLSGEAA